MQLSQNFLIAPFTSAVMSEMNIIVGTTSFVVARECIAPSAYVLITLVFFAMPLELKKLTKLWFYSTLAFTLFNLIRIIFLIWLFAAFGQVAFDRYHLIFYQGLSGLVLAAIALYFLRKEKGKVYPVYSDMKYLIGQLKKSKKKSSNY